MHFRAWHKKLGVDPNRIFVTGMSAGGLYASYLGLMRSTVIAASAPMSIDTVVGAILHPRVLRRRPKELHIPPLKGALARGIDLFPGALSPVLTRLKGRRASDE